MILRHRGRALDSSSPEQSIESPYWLPEADLNEAALRRTHSRVAEPTVEVI
jgi:hypothetical protein